MEEAMGGDACSIGVPLLVDNVKRKLNGSECHDYYNNDAAGTTFFKTCFNTINCLSGIGMLSIPYALSSGGWWSLIFLLGIALATTYTGLLIKRCMDLCPDTKSYPDIGNAAFGKGGRLLVSVFVHVELYLGATVFLILLGDNLNKLFPDVGLQIGGLSIEGKQLFTVIVALVILPTVLVKDLRVLSYVSASGVLASIILIVSVFWVGAFNGVGFYGKIESLSWTGLPRALSIYAACYSAHPLFPTFYTSMRNQTQFPQVLKLSFLFYTVTCLLMAVTGCLMFGSEVQSQITLNLPIQLISSKLAIYTTLVNPVAKYSIIVTPVVRSIEDWFPSSTQMSLFIRTSVVFSSVLVALLFPTFIDLLSLAGAFIVVTTCSIIPCLCYLKISGIFRRSGFELVMIGSILVISVFIAAIGTYDSVLEIVK